MKEDWLDNMLGVPEEPCSFWRDFCSIWWSGFKFFAATVGILLGVLILAFMLITWIY